jgi:hypothetical protein
MMLEKGHFTSEKRVHLDKLIKRTMGNYTKQVAFEVLSGL